MTGITSRPAPRRASRRRSRSRARGSRHERGFAAIRPASRRLPPQLGRTLTAARLTTYDLVQQAIAHSPSDAEGPAFRELRFGGLRGGWALLNRREWRTHNYELVPGVVLTVVLNRHPYLRRDRRGNNKVVCAGAKFHRRTREKNGRAGCYAASAALGSIPYGRLLKSRATLTDRGAMSSNPVRLRS